MGRVRPRSPHALPVLTEGKRRDFEQKVTKITKEDGNTEAEAPGYRCGVFIRSPLRPLVPSVFKELLPFRNRSL
jgi:hypothetical protein